MTNQMAPRIDCERQHPILAVPNVAAAIEFYTKKLGFTVGFTVGEPATFAGVNLDQVQLFLMQGPSNPKGCSVFFVIGNADELLAFHEKNGVEIMEPIADREYGLRD